MRWVVRLLEGSAGSDSHEASRLVTEAGDYRDPEGIERFTRAVH